ncbi:MAG: CGNR zinc finger domain-containing protein [Sphingomonadaceae bacterium]
MTDTNVKIVREKIAAGVGNCLTLEFANTAGWHLSDTPSERLVGWPEIVRWMGEMKLLSREDQPRLSAARGDTARVVTIREDIFRLGLARAKGNKPPRNIVERLMLAAGGRAPKVAASSTGLEWTFTARHAAEELATLLARDALSLFCSPTAEKIGLCEGGECGWLFLDESRSGRRRWCSMNDCGARAKAKRHYDRAKQSHAH